LAPLRQLIARRLADKGVEAAPERIVLTESGTQAIDLICRLVLEPGDTVVVDDPCYFNFQALLRAHRVTVAGVAHTPSGPDIAAFAAALARHIALAEISVGFVEEPPYLADAATGIGERSLCLPFFAAAGGHVTDDIPEALDKADFSGLRLAPLGLAPAVPDLVARAIASDR
jgi:hypothetical protein